MPASRTPRHTQARQTHNGSVSATIRQKEQSSPEHLQADNADIGHQDSPDPRAHPCAEMLPGKQLRTVTRSVDTHSHTGSDAIARGWKRPLRAPQTRARRPRPQPRPRAAAGTPSARSRSQGATQPVPQTDAQGHSAKRALLQPGTKASAPCAPPGGVGLRPSPRDPARGCRSRTDGRRAPRPHLLATPRRADRPLRRGPRVLPPAGGSLSAPQLGVPAAQPRRGERAGLAAPLSPLLRSLRSARPAARLQPQPDSRRRRARPPPRLLPPQGGGRGRRPGAGPSGAAEPAGVAGMGPPTVPAGVPDR